MRGSDTTTFRADAYESTVKRMRDAGEGVHDRGEQVLRQTGKVDPLVDVMGGQKRVSRNAFAQIDGKPVLTRGVSLPVLTAFDGTGSMGGNVAKAFEAIGRLFTVLQPLSSRVNVQIASSVWQDVCDWEDYGYPTIQVSQFESDERVAEQMRLLLPAKAGGDTTEDYQLGLLYTLRQVETDWQEYYGLKPYLIVVADEVGRDEIRPSTAKKHLGIELQSTVTTVEVCRQLLRSWQVFYLNVGGGDGSPSSRVTSWWSRLLGPGRVIEVPNRSLEFLAELQAGLVWVGETAQPTRDGLASFLLAGGQNRAIDRRQAEWVWDLLQPASQHFGAQTRLPNHSRLPKRGDVFAHYRDPYPPTHELAHLNPSQQGVVRPTNPASSSDEPIDWNAF